MSMKMSVDGIADINKILKELPAREGKNLMRATVQDIAKQLADTAKKFTPHDDSGDLEAGIKVKRERGDKSTVQSTVRSAAFYWRFLEYGQGPDGVEHAFFLQALQEMRPKMDRIYLEAFTKKLIARIEREKKRQAG